MVGCEMDMFVSEESHIQVDHHPQTSHGAHTHVGAPPRLLHGLR